MGAIGAIGAIGASPQIQYESRVCPGHIECSMSHPHHSLMDPYLSREYLRGKIPSQ